MKTLEAILQDTKRGVKVLPLQTSFRLPLSGVKNVQGYAPNLKAAESAIEGMIETKYIDEIEPKAGDLIVSRINANIFSLAFQLLRKKVPVRIQGRDFSKQLVRVITKTYDKDAPIEVAKKAIEDFDVSERERISKKKFQDRLIDTHNEKISCLYTLAEGCKTVQEMLDTIEELFNEDLKRENVVLLSTVHQAKGLEANHVYFLEPNLVPHPMAKTTQEKEQEYNIKFVAETRHIETLTYVYERDE